MIASAADLHDLGTINVAPFEVVYAFVSVVGEPSALEESLLDHEEQVRAARFIRPADRHRFVLAHASLRLFLARCAEIVPTGVRYEVSPYGKPRLATGISSLEFNLSHSGELALIAVTRDRPVGVDVEQVRDLPEALTIARSYFSPAERNALRSWPSAEQLGAFFRCWTRKEAVIKALGDGLSRPLHSFEVELAPGSVSALRRIDRRSGSQSGWALRDLMAPVGYTAAGAVDDCVRPVRWRELVIEARDTAPDAAVDRVPRTA